MFAVDGRNISDCSYLASNSSRYVIRLTLIAARFCTVYVNYNLSHITATLLGYFYNYLGKYGPNLSHLVLLSPHPLHSIDFNCSSSLKQQKSFRPTYRPTVILQCLKSCICMSRFEKSKCYCNFIAS